MNGVFVWIDQVDGQALPASWEALGVGRLAADTLQQPLSAVIFGHQIDGLRQAAVERGADRIFCADDSSLADFRLDSYAAALSQVVTSYSPAVVMAAATSRGRELIATAAFDAGVAPLVDVTALSMIDGVVHVIHPVYAGKIISEQVGRADRVQFVTTRSRAFPAPVLNPVSREVEVIALPVPAPSAIRIDSFEPTHNTVSLTDARIIVSGGRGVGGPEGFVPVRELAEVLGAAVGASRATVDAGWIPYAHQVGQTGKTVSPDLYIAVGLSGAIQHQAGMRTSKVIVAINKDPDAPILKLAQYAIIGDLFKILPALTQAFRQALGKA